MRRRTTVLAVLLAGALTVLTACGSDDPAPSTQSTPAPSSTGSASPTPSATTTGDPNAAALDKALKQYAFATPPPNTPGVSGAVGAKPTIAKPAGTAPTKVVIKDLDPGSGPSARVGAKVSVDYHGVEWASGTVFDSSFGKAPVTFELGQLIPCWQLGIPGMREGGRRLLTCPPDLAYGPKGSGHQLAGKTLVFVIDLKKASA